MRTILWESGKKFKGPFRTLQWTSSYNPTDSLSKTVWQVRTNVRKFTYIKWLKLKVIHSPEILDLGLQRALYDLPEFWKDELYLALLRARAEDRSLEDLYIKRYLRILEIFGLPEMSFQLFQTLNGVVRFTIQEIRVDIPAAIKYSGYVRSIAALGKGSIGNQRPLPETFEWTNSDVIDWYTALTVGRVTSSSWEIELP